MKLPKVASMEDVVRLVEEIGFLPFFENSIPGFSLEECVDPRYWFPAEGDGVWEWKGPVIRASGCAYGKFFGGKAAFISKEWFPDFANFRRQGYDMDALYDDGYARRDDLDMWQCLADKGPLLTHELKRLGNFCKGGKKGFEGIITRLQMECYVVVRDFEYRQDRLGRAYGWGVARYATAEEQFGPEFTEKVYQRPPRESEELLWGQLLSVVGERYVDELERLLEKGRVVKEEKG